MGFTLRTTFIVGFPGETDEQFAHLMGFVRDVQFDRLGAFTYSPEEDTPAARMDGQLPEEIKQKRLDRADDRAADLLAGAEPAADRHGRKGAGGDRGRQRPRRRPQRGRKRRTPTA